MKKKIWIPILIVAVIAILVIPIPTGTYNGVVEHGNTHR